MQVRLWTALTNALHASSLHRDGFKSAIGRPDPFVGLYGRITGGLVTLGSHMPLPRHVLRQSMDCT